MKTTLNLIVIVCLMSMFCALPAFSETVPSESVEDSALPSDGLSQREITITQEINGFTNIHGQFVIESNVDGITIAATFYDRLQLDTILEQQESFVINLDEIPWEYLNHDGNLVPLKGSILKLLADQENTSFRSNRALGGIVNVEDGPIFISIRNPAPESGYPHYLPGNCDSSQCSGWCKSAVYKGIKDENGKIVDTLKISYNGTCKKNPDPLFPNCECFPNRNPWEGIE